MMTDPRQFRELYPFESRWLDLGGIRMHYLDEGRGDPVLMLHGNPTWSFYFRDLVIALRPHHRCIVPDHVGCGLSDKPSDRQYRYTLESRVRDIEALLEHLGIEENLTLVLHDWGGMIGMAVASRRPELIARLVILNTAAFLLPQGKRLPGLLRLVRNHRLFGTVAVQGFNAFSRGAARLASANGLSAAVRVGLTAPYDTWSHRRATLRFVQDIPLAPGDPSYDLARFVDDNLHRFSNLPTMLCWGLKDFVFDSDILEEWRRRFPAAKVHVRPDAGHYLLEDAADQVIPLIRGFLANHKRPCKAAHRDGRPAMLNVAAHLAKAAAANPNQRAIVWTKSRRADGTVEYDQITFGELDRETDRYAHGLVEAGIRRGTRTILMVRPSVEFFLLTFALYKIGAVPILIDPGMGRRRMADCLREVDAEAFVGVPLAQTFRLLHRSAFGGLRLVVTVGRRWAWGGRRMKDLRLDSWRPFPIAQTRPDHPAAIIFTTGSTGPPKGVLYEHSMFDAQVRLLREHFQIGPGEIDLPTFPLFALFDPALGMTAVLPDMDPTRPALVNAEFIIRSIVDQQVTHMFGSPALLDRVGHYGQAHGVKLPSLKRVASAGAPVPSANLERFTSMLADDAVIHTPYGATEALPVASITSREILNETRRATERGAGTCVGRPLPEATVRIIRIDDGPVAAWSEALSLPTGQIGEIVVQGPMVTRRYVTGVHANGLAKIADGQAVWHRMGDVGYLDDQGRLWFCGRKSHRVVTPHGTLFTDPCEAVFNVHPRVIRSALVGVGAPPDQTPVICIELRPSDDKRDLPLLTKELLDMAKGNEATRTIAAVLYHPAFPVDIRHNSKIFREQLAIWAAERLK